MPNGFKDDQFKEPPDHAKEIYHDLKINALCFVGTNETYFDRDIRVDHIFDKYDYSSPKKVSPPAGILTDHENTWWDKEMVMQRRNHQTRFVSLICIQAQMSTDICSESTLLRFMILINIEDNAKWF